MEWNKSASNTSLLNSTAVKTEDIPILYLNVVEASNLALEKKNGKIVVVPSLVTPDDRTVSPPLRTSTIKSKRNPRWTEEFLFHVTESDLILKVQVLLQDFTTKKHGPAQSFRENITMRKKTIMQFLNRKQDREEKKEEQESTICIGEVIVPLKELSNGQVIDEWYNISPTDDLLAHHRRSGSVIDGTSNSQLHLKHQYCRSTQNAEKLQDTKRSVLMDLIMSPDLTVISALCDAADMAETDKIAPTVIRMFEYHNRTRDLLKFFLKKEVQLTASTSVLFRSSSMAIKLVSVYAKMTGIPYLQVLGPLVRDICKLPTSAAYEIDPNKAKMAIDIAANAERLTNLIQRFLSAIFNSVDKCPAPIREICNQLRIIVGARFPDFWQISIGGFIFLRLFCPAILVPDAFKLVDAPPNEEARRILVLVAKNLQNISNGTVSGKEDYMEKLNHLITSNKEAVETFFSKLAEPTNSAPQGEAITVSPDELLSDLYIVHKYINMYADKITRLYTEDKESYKNLPIQQLLSAVKALNQDESQKPVPFSSYTAVLKTKGAIKMQQESTFDAYWKVQQQIVRLMSEEEESIVLNATPEFIGSARDCCIIVHELLSNMLDLFLRFEGKWNVIKSSKEYEKFCVDITELQKVELYVNEAALKTFWINLFNTIVLHLHVVMGPPVNSFQRKTFFTYYKYMVGRHSFSLLDIQDGIIRGNPKNKFTRKRHFYGQDYRKRLVIPLDRRVHFVLSYLNNSTPVIRIYNARTIEEEMQFAGELFVGKHMKINVEKSEVILPLLFQKYNGEDFPSNKQELLIWLFQFLNTRKRLDLLLLLEAGSYHIKYSDYSWETLTLRTSVKGKKSIASVVHSIQSILRSIWTEVAMCSSKDVVIDVANTIKAISNKLQQAKPLFINDANKMGQVVSATMMQILVLSPTQKEKIPKEKQAVFLKLLRRICATIEEVMKLLDDCIASMGNAEIANASLMMTIITIGKEAKQLDDRLRANSTSQKAPGEKTTFLLLQAVAAEIIDICNMLKAIEQELNQLNLNGNIKHQMLLVTFGYIVRYMKQQLEIDITKTELLPPFEMKPEKLAVVKHYRNGNNKLNTLLTMTKDNINKNILPNFKMTLVKLSGETSTRSVVLIATKVRNCRNALRCIKGKRLRGAGTANNSRLTIRILEASKTQLLLNEYLNKQN